MRCLWFACVLLAGIPHAVADSRQERQAAELKCAARDPSCDWLAAMSSLERQSVTRAITKRGYTVEPAPWGKTIGAIRIYNEDVFAEKFGMLEFFNNFHVTTKDWAIRAEVVIGVGEVWDQKRVDETARRLRNPLWTTVAIVIPVKSAEDGKVDMLVVTRDIWSLRLNTKYTYQQGSLTALSIALSENNFLGTRSLFAMGFVMNQGAIATGPIYLDNNLTPYRLSLSAKFDVILNRQNLLQNFDLAQGPATISEVDKAGFAREGTQSAVTLSKPLFALASEWGAGISFSHRNAIDRGFRGLGLSPRDCSSGTCVFPVNANNQVRPILDLARDNPDATILGVQYRMRRWDVTASAVRQWGYRLKQQLQIGYSVDDTDPTLLPSFPGNAIEREAFIRDVLPRNERTSTPFIAYGFFEPKFRALRNIDTYDLAEDVRLGASFDVAYSISPQLLGSTNSFMRASWSASYGIPWCNDGFIRPGVGMSTRMQDFDEDGDRDFVDNNASFTLRMVSPSYKWARLVGELALATRWNDKSNAFFGIGGANSLRGFEINQFQGVRTGDRLVRTQLELRSIPRPLWVFRYGGVLFYDVGGVSDTLFAARPMVLHQNVGVGFRLLIPQTQRDLFRFDLAFPFEKNSDCGANGCTAYSPTFVASFDQAF